MLLMLFINTPERIYEMPLPAIDNKQISVDISEICTGCSLELEVYDGVWKLLPADGFLYSAEACDGGIRIYDGLTVTVSSRKETLFAVMARAVEAEKNKYRIFSAGNKTSVSVGRAADNDIVINDEFTGSHHCVIETGRNGMLYDKSRNGTYINGARVKECGQLELLDTIYITGHRIIFLGNALAICENDYAAVNLKEADMQELTNKEYYEDDSLFSRAPRRITPVDSTAIEIDDPPAKQKNRPQPLIFVIGPSVTMPIPILVSVLVNIASSAGAASTGSMYLGTLISVFLSAAIGTGWTLAHRSYNKKISSEDEAERKNAYLSYIDNNRKLLEKKHIECRKIMDNTYLTTDRLLRMPSERSVQLWNRNIYQNDFLTVRLGTGKVKLPSEIAVSKKRFSMNNDELCSLPHMLYDEFRIIEDSAAVLNLMEHKIIGMVGNEKSLTLIANNIICQTAALHCYTDVKIGIIADNTDAAAYMWTKWLPHSFMSGSDVRITGFDRTSREKTIYEIASELRRRQDNSEERRNRRMILPHIIVFCTSPELIRNSVLSGYLETPSYIGVTFVLIYNRIDHLPNECRAVIECSDDFSGFYMLDGEISDENSISFECVSSPDAERFARAMSGIYAGDTANAAVPASVDYFDMLRLGNIGQWNLIKRYKSSSSVEGIKAFIGLGNGGKPVYLDIHDKKDGPHGLVAGTTGSGKSETLQTFILSLAMNYSPDDVAFVLIDYKGGGMANVFEGIPHISGIITNLSDESGGELDKRLTERACSSLKSEIKRRQRIFKEYGINHIDNYTMLFKDGKAEQPVPHLVIISDEFAELKKEQPEFIKELISVARVGRSLGIHLILATQKPSGVVDDEIWSNSRFRICLRVQDRQDSSGMLKRPDAAYITNAGRAFLQIGNDEVFEEFQSGYSGGEYIPTEEAISAADNEASIIGIDGSPAVKRTSRRSQSGKETELAAAVKYIGRLCAENSYNAARALWLPPLEKQIYLSDISFSGNASQLSCGYAVADDYGKQSRFPCTVNLASLSNLKICGAAGTGKTTLLQTILCSAAGRYSPEQFVFYIMDYSSRTMKLFRQLPHCGGVVYEEEAEGAERLIRLICTMVDERKRLFENDNAGSYGEYIRQHSLPLVLLIIDNFSVFAELYSGFEDTLLRLMHDGTRYGIQVVVTLNNASELKYKMRQYVTDSIVLRMSEKSEYSELLGRTPEFLPASSPGRGLTVSGAGAIEFQTALPVKGNSDAERAENMKKEFAALAEKYKGCKAAMPIPVISADMTYSELLETSAERESLLLGYDFENIIPCNVPFSEFYCYCAGSTNFKGTELFLNNTAQYAEHFGIDIRAVSLSSSVSLRLPQRSTVYSGGEEIKSLMDFLAEEFTKRNRAVPEWKALENRPLRDSFMAEKFGRIFIIIDSMADFCETLKTVSSDENLYSLAESFFSQGRDHGIHFFGGYSASKKTYISLSNIFKSENHGIHLGGETGEQNVLEIDIPMAMKMKRFDNNIGFTAEDGKASMVFIPLK